MKRPSFITTIENMSDKKVVKVRLSNLDANLSSNLVVSSKLLHACYTKVMLITTTKATMALFEKWKILLTIQANI